MGVINKFQGLVGKVGVTVSHQGIGEKCAAFLKEKGVSLRSTEQPNASVRIKELKNGAYICPEKGRLVNYFHKVDGYSKNNFSEGLNSDKGSRFMEIKSEDYCIKLFFEKVPEADNWEKHDFEPFSYKFETGIKYSGDNKWTGKTS